MSDLVAQARQLYELAWLGKSARVRELATAQLDTAMRELRQADPARYQALCEERFARAKWLQRLPRATEVQA